MPQADNVVTFPADRATNDLLRDYIGSPQERLDELTYRVAGIEALLGVLRVAEGVPEHIRLALSGIEALAHDCFRVCELRPAGGAR